MALNLRSPTYSTSSILNTHYGILDITIWQGDKNTIPPDSNYNLKKYTIEGSVELSFEVSELIKDYIDITFDGSYQGQEVWVELKTSLFDVDNNPLQTILKTSIAFDGYSYFEELGGNNSLESVLISNREVFALADNVFRIPIHTKENPTVTFLKDGVNLYTQSFSASDLSSEQVEYVSINGTDVKYDSFKSRVLEDDGIFEDSQCLKSFLSEFEIGEVDQVIVSEATGQFENRLETIKINTLEECKYEPKKITFINKHGVLQDMYFFKKSVAKINIKKESYKANILNQYSDYSRSEHVKRDFNIVANESFSLSSGYLSEAYNEVFKQLLLSEKVWITNVSDLDVKVLPINVTTSDITYKTSLNDKLVEYTIEFENSFDTIKNIR